MISRTWLKYRLPYLFFISPSCIRLFTRTIDLETRLIGIFLFLVIHSQCTDRKPVGTIAGFTCIILIYYFSKYVHVFFGYYTVPNTSVSDLILRGSKISIGFTLFYTFIVNIVIWKKKMYLNIPFTIGKIIVLH